MKLLNSLKRKPKVSREAYLLTVIEQMVHNGGLSALKKVNDIPGYKLRISHEVCGPKLVLDEA